MSVAIWLLVALTGGILWEAVKARHILEECLKVLKQTQN